MAWSICHGMPPLSVAYLEIRQRGEQASRGRPRTLKRSRQMMTYLAGGALILHGSRGGVSYTVGGAAAPPTLSFATPTVWLATMGAESGGTGKRPPVDKSAGGIPRN